MKMYPPAQVNKMVTDASYHWLMSQPTTSTIPIPNGVEVPKDLSSAEWMNVIGEWQKANKSLKITTTSPNIQDYSIEDNLRHLMLRELIAILAYNGFSSELLSDDKLKISKDRWSMEVENILDQMPFADYLPYQIEEAYKHHEHESRDSEHNNASYPSRERLESIRKIVVDSTKGDI